MMLPITAVLTELESRTGVTVVLPEEKTNHPKAKHEGGAWPNNNA